jgi:hypothetical protein
LSARESSWSKIAGALGDIEALAEIAVGPVVLPQVGVGDAEIHVGRGRAVLVVRGAIRFDRLFVVTHGLDQLAPDVGENAEVLLDARAQFTRLSATLECLLEVAARLVGGARSEGKAPHRVQRLGGEYFVAETAGDFVAAVAELARAGRLVAMMQHDGETPQRLGQHRPLAVALGGGDRRFEALNRLRNAGIPLAGPRFVQQVRGGLVHHATT